MDKQELITVEEGFEILKNKQITSSEQVFRRWLRENKIQGAVISSKKKGWSIPKNSLLAYIEDFKRKKEEIRARSKYSAKYEEIKNIAYQEGYSKAESDCADKIDKLNVKNKRVNAKEVKKAYEEGYNKAILELEDRKKSLDNDEELKKAFAEGYKNAFIEIDNRDKKLITGFFPVFEEQKMILRADIRERGEGIFTSQSDKKAFLKYLDDSLFKVHTKTVKNKIEVNFLGNWILIQDTRELFNIKDLELDSSYDNIARLIETILEKKRLEYISKMK